jgi:hypothetical protein
MPKHHFVRVYSWRQSATQYLKCVINITHLLLYPLYQIYTIWMGPGTGQTPVSKRAIPSLVGVFIFSSQPVPSKVTD